MKTTEIAILDQLDEFDFEQAYLQVPRTLATLRRRERVILVQDASCALVVTLDRGRTLTLWNPEVHWADQARRPFQGTLAEAVAQATAWLARYLRVDPGEAIAPVIDVGAFPGAPLTRPKASAAP